jgi:hypothetical protein
MPSKAASSRKAPYVVAQSIAIRFPVKKSKKNSISRVEFFISGNSTNSKFSGLNNPSFQVLIKFLPANGLYPVFGQWPRRPLFYQVAFGYRPPYRLILFPNSESPGDVPHKINLCGRWGIFDFSLPRTRIVSAIRAGKITRSIVWQNIILATSVKAIVLLLGAGGIATLWEAVFADVGVALLAILNGFSVKESKKFPIGRVEFFCVGNIPDKQTSGS